MAENNVYYVKADGTGAYALDVKTATDAGAVTIYCKANAIESAADRHKQNRTAERQRYYYGNGANFNGGQINIQPGCKCERYVVSCD